MMAASAFTVVCATALLLLLQPAQAQPTADELTFPKLRDVWNTTNQWGLAFATGNKATGPVFTPVNCIDPTLGACTNKNPALKQNNGDQLRVNYTMRAGRGPNGAHNTYQGLAPTHFQIRVCHTLNSSVDRAWRKKNKPYPRLTQNCPRTVATIPFVGSHLTPDIDSNTGVVVWDLDKEDEIPKSTWFLMLWVWCGDSQVCAFQSTEGRPDQNPKVEGNFIETDSEMGITKGMIVAAVICSIIGPAFFITFYIADIFHYRKTGKPIRLF